MEEDYQPHHRFGGVPFRFVFRKGKPVGAKGQDDSIHAVYLFRLSRFRWNIKLQQVVTPKDVNFEGTGSAITLRALGGLGVIDKDPLPIVT